MLFVDLSELRNIYKRYVVAGILIEARRHEVLKHLHSTLNDSIFPAVSLLLHDNDQLLLFSDFCLVYAFSVNIPRNLPMPCVSHQKYDVFLGGACNPTSWRQLIAIPFLKENRLSFYNPQSSEWHPGLVNEEREAKISSTYLLFAFEPWTTRCLASMVEAAYLIGRNAKLILIWMNQPSEVLPVINGESISKAEYMSLQQCMDYLKQLAKASLTPTFNDLTSALVYLKERIFEIRSRDEEKPDPKLTNLELSVLRNISMVHDTFRSLSGTKDGCVTTEQARIGLQLLNADLPCPAVKSTVSMNFEAFCMSYLEYSFQHYAQSLSIIENWELESGGPTAISKSRPTSQSVSSEPVTPEHCCQPSLPSRRSLSATPSYKSSIKNWFSSIWKTLVARSDAKHCRLVNDIYIGGSYLTEFGQQESWFETELAPQLKQNGVLYHLTDSFTSTELAFLQNECFHRLHSRVLLFVVSNRTLHLRTMLEAAFSIGRGLPVVLCVDDIPLNHARNLTGLNCPRRTERTHSLENRSRLNQTADLFAPTSCPIDNKGDLINSVVSPSADSGLGPETPTSLDSWDAALDSKRDVPSPDMIRNHKRPFAQSSKSGSISPVLNDSCSVVVSSNSTDHINQFALSQSAINDHNRMRKYLVSVAEEMHVSTVDTVLAALPVCLARL